MNATLRLLAGALLLTAFSAGARAQEDGWCPNEQATQKDARLVSAGETERCGFGIRIFGIGGGLFGPRCPDKKFIYPAHQKCEGDENVGTWCRPEGNLDVDVEDCECVEATILGTGLLIPSCECSDGGTAGHVQDARTETCRLEV